jgi:hypothetical protein
MNEPVLIGINEILANIAAFHKFSVVKFGYIQNLMTWIRLYKSAQETNFAVAKIV